jgi:hypothetical protein
MLNDFSTWKSIDVCDVKDRGLVSAARPKLQCWKTLLAGPDPFSIENQFLGILWDDTLYRTFNEGLRLNERSSQPVPIPSSIIHLFRRRYIEGYAIRMRRLFEVPNGRTNRKVISIPTVIEEMEKSIGKLTREVYVGYDGAPFNGETCPQDWQLRLCSNVRHRVFDSLSISTDGRRTDRINSSILDAIKKEIEDKRERLEFNVNKYIAHAADPQNRVHQNPRDGKSLSLLDLQRYLKLGMWASILLGKIADQLVMTEVPVSTYDQFENWDRFFTPRVKRKLQSYWKKRVELFNRWTVEYKRDDMLILQP